MAHLSAYLPARPEGPVNTAPFLEDVSRAAVEALDTCARPAPQEVRRALGDLSGSARAFRIALDALHDPEIEKRLRLHLAESAELVSRLRADIDAVMAGTDYAVKSLQSAGAKQPATQAARGLIVRVAMAHLRCFQSLPPPRAWFGNDFMPNLGRMIGIPVDCDVVVEIVKLLEEES
ncbi:hypothetical protein QTI66_31305 [Variovorax sp. J22R133]|uniref:hypothetical protein n=1 Tax=Variovorax brevis TaxID=3053503 RepID=UPI002576C5D0|nr:hypothetical protein [Variovorax sp. J22R133]MDM0116630.1 hypothetical protein [Variovorax sp. J22R133]